MDVSFNNVLKGARQYFQGLPSVSSSTANSSSYPTTAERQNNHYGVEQNQERTSASAASYWPPHQDTQLRPPTRDRLSIDSLQRPPSHQPETPRPSSHNQTVNQLQEQLRTPTNYHTQTAHQEQLVPTSHSYQFSRPHSREVQQQQHVNQQQAQPQYQSHILPNPSYHQTSTTQQAQPRAPSRIQDHTPPTSMPSQSYHQMQQQPQNHGQQPQNLNQQSYSNYQQQSRSYYPVHSQSEQQQSQSYHNPYQVSNQAYSQPQASSYLNQSYASHSQNSFQNDNSYASAKSSTQDMNSLKENQSTQNQHVTQAYRTTHNLPPIAALSSLNYHSSRSSREVTRIANNKTRTPTSSAIYTPSYSTKSVTEASAVSQHGSRVPLQYSGHNEYASSVQQNRATSSQAQSYHYTTAATTTTQSTNQYPSTSTGSIPTASSSSSVQNQSSNSHSNFQPHPAYTHQETAKTYQPPPNPKLHQQGQQASANQTGNLPSNSGMTAVMKQKRESPLDLSVKTVRTSADSTLDDADANTNEVQRLAKYYQPGRPPMHSPMQAPVSYPTYDVYANSFQRNVAAKSSQVSNTATGAPKVDFFPNFNIPLNQQASNKVDNRRLPVQTGYDNLTQRQAYDRKNVYHQQVAAPQSSIRHPANPVPTSAHANTNSTSALQNSTKKQLQGLPRIDFLPPTHKASGIYNAPDTQRKRSNEPLPPMVPNKIQKVDVWRQTIDQQIEQRLSSYAKSRQQDQIQKQPNIPNKHINGNYASISQDRNKELYQSAYHRQQYNALQPQSYANSNHYNPQTSHSQTYVPTATAHQYPGYTNHLGSQQQQALYAQHSLTKSNSTPSLPGSIRNSVGGAADRRVLSLLRNSLEIKEAQKKLEQEQQKPQEHHLLHPRSDIQQPSTDVMAPLQPKSGLVGRHNMSPFAATSLFDRNSNTPPTYKFHLPKAIDSIKFDAEMTKDNRTAEKVINKHADGSHPAMPNANTDLDGLAAFLAARIRTKAELKQVGPTQNAYNNNSANSNLIRSSSEMHLSRMQNKQMEYLPTQHSSNGASPPKLNRERVAYPPRRRLFSRNEEDPVCIVPPRDKSGLRSSSETSVFDFPDSDSETEMPVLERQSLVDMRRDRKIYPKPAVTDEVEPSLPLCPMDVLFDDTCDKFMEQLKTGVGKKRGRRKKIVEPDVLAKLETVVTQREIKIEVEDVMAIKEEPKAEIEDEKEHIIKQKTDSDSDSDVPLIKCKGKSVAVGGNVSDAEDTVEEIKTIKPEVIKKSEISSDTSDSESETVKTESNKIDVNEPDKEKKESTPTKSAKSVGDGTDFHPGWEEEVYKYKRSLRMPAALIHVTRPPQWHRLSTSLPDLDPCPNSPSPSENTEFSKTKVKGEPVDSDIDSNSNFSFSFGKNNYDSEEGSSSVKSVSVASSIKPKNSNSILDRLLERCGPRKRKKLKKKNEEMVPKIIPKSENQLELLPTPSLQIEAKSTKKEQIIKEESVFLGFRKKTIDNFKDTFISNSNSLVGVNEQFKTVVLKSRTRLETRVLKQKATIKEVFGEDRPASAPPVTCVDNTEGPDDTENKPSLNITFSKDDNMIPSVDKLSVNSVLGNTKEALKNKLLNRGRKGNETLLKSIATKKMISDYVDDDVVIKRDPDSKSETPSIDGDEYNVPTRRRMKNIRRKFSSGFDYIRKKKKQVKKEGSESEVANKPKRRGLMPKTSPESVQDIQKEIKMWVMNKGIGETHLHRAARLGYTDITAYCLEKMDGSASPKDNAGYTPLHEACARGHLGIAKLLLLYGANVSESAQGGIRPLHEAAENGFVEIVRLLLSYGADPMLATYSGLTPLSLATDEATVNLLQSHIADLQGQPSATWHFLGPASCFDLEENGYNPLEDAANPDPISEDEDVEFEISDAPLPNLYTIRGEPQTDRWILLQDLSNILKIKSRDALLRQISPISPSTSTTVNYKSVLRELKMADFLEQASCCQYMCAGEKINTRASKIALVKYSDKVRQLLGVEKVIITAR